MSVVRVVNNKLGFIYFLFLFFLSLDSDKGYDMMSYMTVTQVTRCNKRVIAITVT